MLFRSPAAPLPCFYTCLLHEAPGLVTANVVAAAPQFSGHAAAAIAATLLEMNLSDFVVQGLARFIRVTSSPVIATTPADLHNPTQHDHGISGLLRLDELVSQLDSLAKKAAAFFKISFSI